MHTLPVRPGLGFTSIATIAFPVVLACLPDVSKDLCFLRNCDKESATFLMLAGRLVVVDDCALRGLLLSGVACAVSSSCIAFISRAPFVRAILGAIASEFLISSTRSPPLDELSDGQSLRTPILSGSKRACRLSQCGLRIGDVPVLCCLLFERLLLADSHG